MGARGDLASYAAELGETPASYADLPPSCFPSRTCPETPAAYADLPPALFFSRKSPLLLAIRLMPIALGGTSVRRSVTQTKGQIRASTKSALFGCFIPIHQPAHARWLVLVRSSKSRVLRSFVTAVVTVGEPLVGSPSVTPVVV